MSHVKGSAESRGYDSGTRSADQRVVARKKLWISMLSGSGAGAASAVFTAPFDVVRTRLAVQRTPVGAAAQGVRYLGLVGSFKTIFREEGLRGFYRGLGPILVALVPNWAIYFGVYNSMKNGASRLGYEDGPLTHLCSAMGAAIVTDIATNPLWMVKTRLQTQHMQPGAPERYQNTFQALRLVAKEEGVRALWSGLTPQLVGVMHVAIQFPVYEYLKKLCMRRGKKGNDQLSLLELIFCSSVSKLIASALAYPHEVLRSRMQYQRADDPGRYRGLLDSVRRIAGEEGYRGFYNGLGTNLVRTVPAAAITLTTYELIQRTLFKLWNVQ